MKPGTLVKLMLLAAAGLGVALARAVDWTRAHLVGLAAVTLVLVATALFLWHQQQMARHRRSWALGEDWEKVPGFAHREVWACPRCRGLVAGIDQIEGHQDPAVSPCAALWVHQEETDRAAQNGARTLPGAHWMTGVAGSDGIVDTLAEESE